jgi:hypothetical protein
MKVGQEPMTFGRSGGVPPGLGGPDCADPVELVDPVLEPDVPCPVPPPVPLVAPDVPPGAPVVPDPDAEADPDEVSPVVDPVPEVPGSEPGFDPRSFEPLEDDTEEPLPPPECELFPLEAPLWLAPVDPEVAPPPAPSPGPAVAHAPSVPTRA